MLTAVFIPNIFLISFFFPVVTQYYTNDPETQRLYYRFWELECLGENRFYE